jgi:hypothetical protein
MEEPVCSLSKTQKLVASRIYGLLKDMYDDDPDKIDEFTATMKSMLEDSLDLDSDCNLEYLLEIMDTEDS